MNDKKTDHIVPADTRYVPLQQTPYGCCPTAIQMVMLRHHMPLVPSELLGWHLGLVVPPRDAKYFYNARIVEDSPLYGCFPYLGEMEIDPNEAFKTLGIPLSMEIKPIEGFESQAELESCLEECLAQDLDVLMCLRWLDVMVEQTVTSPADPNAGHIIVIDKFDGQTARIVDPGRGKKWREYDISHLYYSMTRHVNPKIAGLWVMRKV